MNTFKSHLKHKKQSKIVYEVELEFHKALNLPTKEQEKQVYVIWRRGNHFGQTSKAKQAESTATWSSHPDSDSLTSSTEEKGKLRRDSLKTSVPVKIVPSNTVHFRCSLYRNNDGTFDQKILEIKLKQEKERSNDPSKKSSSRSLGELTLNIAEYAERIGEEATKSIPISQTLTKKQKTKGTKVTSCKLQFTIRMFSNGVVIMKNPISPSAIPESQKVNKNSVDDREVVDISSQYSHHSNHSLSSSPDTIRTTSTKSSSGNALKLKQNSTTQVSEHGESVSWGHSSGYSSLSDEALSDEEEMKVTGTSVVSSPSASSSSTNSPRRWLVKMDSVSQVKQEDESVKKGLSTSQSHVFGNNAPNPKPTPQQQKVQLEHFRKGHRRARSDASAFSQPTQSSITSSGSHKLRLHESTDRLGPLLKHSGPSAQRNQKTVLVNSLGNEEINDLIAKQESELEYLKQQLIEKQLLEDQNFLIEKYVLIMEPEYTKNGTPVTAYLLFRSILHWKAFDGQNSRFLDKIIESFGNLLQKHLYNTSILLYWLSTTCSLLNMVRKEVQVMPTFEDFDKKDSDRENPVKAFEKNLQSLIGGYYTTLLKVLYEKLDPIVIPAVLEQPPLGTVQNSGSNVLDVTTVIGLFSQHVHEFRQNFIFVEIQEQFFRQVLYHTNERLFNNLLQRKDLCKCGNGVLIKMAISQLEEWAMNTKVLRNVVDQLAPLRNAADLLVMNKAILADEENRKEVCGALNDKQILHILRFYSPDEFDSEPVHPGVISEISARQRERDQLLFDTTFAFPLVTSFDHKVPFDRKSIAIPADLLERPGFDFLSEDV